MTAEWVFSQGFAVAVVLGIAWFISQQWWPHYKTKDEEQRKHRNSLEVARLESDQANSDRAFELDSKRAVTDQALADGVKALAAAVSAALDAVLPDGK